MQKKLLTKFNTIYDKNSPENGHWSESGKEGRRVGFSGWSASC